MTRNPTQPRSIWFFALLAFFFAPALFAADTSVLHANPLHQEKAVTADFDGDQRPDTASSRTIQNYSQVEIQFGSGVLISFESPSLGEATLVAMDVDRDNDTDLIVFGKESEIPAAVWLNNGHGLFTTPKLWRIDASFPIPPPANHPDNDERSSLSNAISFAESLKTPDAKLSEPGHVRPQAQQTIRAFVPQGCSRVLLVSSLHSRSPPVKNSL